MSLQAILMPPSRLPVTGPALVQRRSCFQDNLGEFPSIGYAHNMRDLSDEELMQRYAAGEAEAFEVLYPRYRDPLYRYIIRQVREPALANDLYQGCWEKVIRSRKNYRPASPFRAWLFRVAHNHVVDHFRSNRPTEELNAERETSPEMGPEARASDVEDGQALLQQLALLPQEQRDALLLRFESGLGLEQIGKITGVSSETVKSRLRYATRKLKQAFKS